MPKKDDFATKLSNTIVRKFRNRKGLKLYGKTLLDFEYKVPVIKDKRIRWEKRVVHLDNEVPGKVIEVFENLMVNKAKQIPIIRNKRRTDYGWWMQIELNIGKSYRQLLKTAEFIADATRAHVDMKRREDGYIDLWVATKPLPDNIPYKWNPVPYLKKMHLPFMVGYTHKGPLVHDVASSPHIIIAGVTSFGKTVLLRCLIHGLLPLGHNRVWICLVDLKGVDFPYLKDHVMTVDTEKDAIRMFEGLWEQHNKRKKLLIKAGVDNLYEIKKRPPSIVCVIDEFAELQDEQSFYWVDKLARLARMSGIHLVACTQRPTADVIPSKTRSQFLTRISFQMASEIDSRTILGEHVSDAAWLPGIRGRGIFTHAIEKKTFQAMLLTRQEAEKMVKDIEGRRWEFATPYKRLQPR